MMSFDTSRYLDAFSDEARELVQVLNEALLSFEDNPAALDTVDEMFRAAHTLKGMAAAMGFGDIAGLTHRMENVLALLRQGKLAVGADLCDTLFRSLDALQEMVEIRSSQQDRELDTDELVWVLETLASGAKAGQPASQHAVSAGSAKHWPAPEQVLAATDGSGRQKYRVGIALTADCRMPNVRAYMVVSQLQRLGEVLATDPGGPALLDEDFGLSFELVLASDAQQAAVEQAASAVPEVDRATIEPVAASAAKGAEPRESKPGTAQRPAGNGPTQSSRQVHSVRVDTDRLDRAMSAAAELELIQRKLAEALAAARSPQLGPELAQAAALTLELRKILTEARLVPIEEVFRRFPRMVRDLAKQRGKQVLLEASGAETVLDRVMVDDLGDILVHLLRNAIDHGIEPPAMRQGRSKPAQGTITLAALDDGQNVVIEVSDDGAGIDIEILRRSAIEQDILSAERAAALSDEQVIELAFTPGLSTAPAVTELSGRGFGMDIVRAKLAQLGGDVRIVTAPGQGTTFTLRVPRRLPGS